MPVTFDIPEDILSAIPGNAADVEARLRLELACALYQRELACFASAAQVAGMHPFAFGRELTRRGIVRHYGEGEMAEDDAYVARHQVEANEDGTISPISIDGRNVFAVGFIG